ncbi:class I adenylate-forming enzyme family protein [Novosphingobium sp. YAF33]|uniref:class I adenylate-forming enzyme family protein n=1 Tax=Novosphingobium sp. YAF33 TaxID=3233082 RepID=UPI003F9DF71E
MNDAPASVIAALRQRALTQPGAPFIADGERWITFGEMWTLACQVRHALLGRGVAAGARVVLEVPSQPWRFVAAYFGTHLAGAIAVPVSASRSGANAAIVQRTSAAVHLDTASFSPFLEECAKQAAAGKGDLDPPLPDPATTADILFTSGTSGSPKGVILSHSAIRSAAAATNEFIGNVASDREVVTVPLSHSFGLGRVRCTVLSGGSMNVVPGLTFPALILEAMADAHVTGLSSVPMTIAVLEHLGEAEFADAAARLRYLELGSAPMPEERKRALARMLPRSRICMHYGLTEASRSCFLEFNTDNDHLWSVGKPAPGVAIRVADEEDRILSAGTQGIIQIRSPARMTGYWLDPQTSAAVCTDDGWLKTNDLGILDEDGYLMLIGRADDQINVGGKKVDPLVIERAALAIAGTRDAGCIGVNDPNGLAGQVPVLFLVVDEPQVFEVRRYLRQLAGALEPHERPVRLVTVAELPRTESGKLKRAQLRRCLAPA